MAYIQKNPKLQPGTSDEVKYQHWGLALLKKKQSYTYIH